MNTEKTNVTETATAPAPAQKPMSEKLNELRAAYKAAYDKARQIEDPFSPEAQTANMELWKIQGEIKKEEAAILKAAAEAKIAEMRNARLALVSNLLEAQKAVLSLPKSATAEQRNDVENKLAEAKQVVENELLAKFAASKPAKSEASGEKAERNSGNTAAIIELYLSGKTHSEIEAEGYARSTVWHAINNYKKANGLK